MRHLETEKNVHHIHGYSSRSAITESGQVQASRIANQITSGGIGKLRAVASVPTPQAIESAKLIAGISGLPYEGSIGLKAVDLGVASGYSNDELRAAHPDAFRALDLFRSRVISAADLRIPGCETSQQIERRLLEWWAAGGDARCIDRLVVCSNSTILILAHFLNGVLPTSPQYKFLATPNGTWSAWSEAGEVWVAEKTRSRKGSWPDLQVTYLPCDLGRVAITRHFPSWVPQDTGVVVVPGYFGSSRHGPYGLYSRLAASWAYEGFETITLDPLGSGDSSPIFRNFESEIVSVVTATEELSRRVSNIIIVGHSMGAATALAARERISSSSCKVWGLAPLCKFSDLADIFLTSQHQEELLRTGRTFRHGLELRKDIIEDSTDAWDRLHSSIDAVWIADADPYTSTVDLSAVAADRVSRIVGADHNFSNENGVKDLQYFTTRMLTSID
jgi:broad specificity phosphatase PhoE